MSKKTKDTYTILYDCLDCAPPFYGPEWSTAWPGEWLGGVQQTYYITLPIGALALDTYLCELCGEPLTRRAQPEPEATPPVQLVLGQ